VKDGICSGDQARWLVRRFARLMTTSALAIATTGTLPPPAKAQQEDGATSPAVSIPVRPALRTDTASTFDIKVTASITSDYNYRGYTLSDHKPSISTNLEATYNILFATINAASVQVPMVSQLQEGNSFRVKRHPLSGKHNHLLRVVERARNLWAHLDDRLASR
jgi:hypothetical protein